MSKVITFSTVFPSYHSKRGKPTDFVYKIIHGIMEESYIKHRSCGFSENIFMSEIPLDILEEYIAKSSNDLLMPKYHTIRSGNRWKVGDVFSPRIWSGKPYKSKQITFAPDIKITKIWDINIDKFGIIFINHKPIHIFKDMLIPDNWETLARNDGLDLDDFLLWFNKLPFNGQIICWSNEIHYENL